jgi:hypothetical protein
MSEIMNAANGTSTENVENPAAEAATSAQEGQNTFTQDDVNRIVGERLAREKAKSDAAFAERERELAQRELRLSAIEKLTDRGLSPALLDALNTSSPAALDKSLDLIEAEIKAAKSKPLLIKGIKPMDGCTPRDTDSGYGIREAMGLK